jgi:hypothetical protein
MTEPSSPLLSNISSHSSQNLALMFGFFALLLMASLFLQQCVTLSISMRGKCFAMCHFVYLRQQFLSYICAHVYIRDKRQLYTGDKNTAISARFVVQYIKKPQHIFTRDKRNR